MPSNDYYWPDARALLDELEIVMADDGHTMIVRDRDAFEAGLARARIMAEYDPDASLTKLAAVMFDGVTTRHALADGNKRAGALSALTLFALNGMYLDVPEMELEQWLRATVAGSATVDALADYFAANVFPDIA
jgi:prophage maintenance system killer protein